MQQLHYSQGVTTQVRATLLRHFQATQAAIHCAAHTPAPPAQPCACQGSGPYAGLWSRRGSSSAASAAASPGGHPTTTTGGELLLAGGRLPHSLTCTWHGPPSFAWQAERWATATVLAGWQHTRPRFHQQAAAAAAAALTPTAQAHFADPAALSVAVLVEGEHALGAHLGAERGRGSQAVMESRDVSCTSQTCNPHGAMMHTPRYSSCWLSSKSSNPPPRPRTRSIVSWASGKVYSMRIP